MHGWYKKSYLISCYSFISPKKMWFSDCKVVCHCHWYRRKPWYCNVLYFKQKDLKTSMFFFCKMFGWVIFR